MTRCRCLHLGAALLALITTAACTPTRPPTAAPDAAARTTTDWQGTYMGTLPSASGTGYRTVLVLRDQERYTLLQDIEHQGQPVAFRAAGRYRWDPADALITLDGEGARQRFVVGPGFVQLRGDLPPAPDMLADYRLTRMASYRGRGDELLVDPRSVRAHQPQAGWVSLDGVWNTRQPARLGHQSLSAHIEIDCAAPSYRLSGVRYHSLTYQRGRLIKGPAGSDRGIPIQPGDPLMTRVMQDHCPR